MKIALGFFFAETCGRLIGVHKVQANGVGMKHSHKHRPHKHSPAEWHEKDPGKLPQTSKDALRKALLIEKLPLGTCDDFLWIMAQESSGVVNVRNSVSTARGLYHLLAAQYSLNPNGKESFGNAVEECQGGIHYIMGRYHSARAAKAFWQKHHWY